MSSNKIFTEPIDQTREIYDAPNQNELRNVYNVGTYEYPKGLRNRDDLQHYIAFFINVRERSSLGRRYIDNKSAIQIQGSEFDRQRSTLSEEAIGSGAQIIVNNPGKIAGTFSLLKNIVTGKIVKDPLGSLAETGGVIVGAAVLGAGVRALDSDFLTSVNTSWRLKNVITLHLENSPTVRYGVNYTEKDLGTLTGLIAQSSAAAAANRLGEYGREAGARILAQLIKLPSIIPGGGTLADLRELSTRSRTNPFREVLFESVDYRTFNFKHRFFPVDAEESRKVREIIKNFKLHMHPEISADKFFYVYPSEFEIKYYYKDRENRFFNTMARCALIGMDIEYGGDQFATFEDGAPTEIGLSLTFRELEQITSQGVEKYGY